jgi:mono/diheme cytochrome c family protein
VISRRAKLGLLASLLLIAGATTAIGAGIQIPEGPGANLVYGKCQTCHDLQYVVDGKGLLAAQWEAVVASMKDYGLEVSDQEKNELAKYLSTYLGPNPPPAAATVTATTAAAKADGKTVYQQNCAACHGDTGAGQPGYFPPLSNNPDLFKDRVFPALVVLHGMSGPITVGGRSYDNTMPALDHLSDAEIAAVVGYVRGSFGNESNASQVKPVTAELVAQQRKESLSPSQVHARREKMGTK